MKVKHLLSRFFKQHLINIPIFLCFMVIYLFNWKLLNSLRVDYKLSFYNVYDLLTMGTILLKLLTGFSLGYCLMTFILIAPHFFTVPYHTTIQRRTCNLLLMAGFLFLSGLSIYQYMSFEESTYQESLSRQEIKVMAQNPELINEYQSLFHDF